MSHCKHIDVAGAEALLAGSQPAMLLDMRDARAYCQGHDPRAIPLTAQTLRSLLLHTPRQMRIVICCADGSASPARAELFADFGFEHCYSLDGGYAAWQARPRQAATPQRIAQRVAAHL